MTLPYIYVKKISESDMNLIEYVKKFKSLLNNIEKDLQREMEKQLKDKEHLQLMLDSGCSKSGMIRGEIKSLIKRTSNDGNIDVETLTKLQELKVELDKHLDEFKEEEIRSKMADIDKECQYIYSCIKIVTE